MSVRSPYICDIAASTHLEIAGFHLTCRESVKLHKSNCRSLKLDCDVHTQYCTMTAQNINRRQIGGVILKSWKMLNSLFFLKRRLHLSTSRIPPNTIHVHVELFIEQNMNIPAVNNSILFNWREIKSIHKTYMLFLSCTWTPYLMIIPNSCRDTSMMADQ